MAVIEGIELTQSQIQTILYIAYGVRLATKNERLTLEHPQMWQYGHVFPRACILSTPHLSEGTPWSETRKSNPDRWGVRIEDDLIREWFLPRV